MKTPLAVCISDIHFNVNNLSLASAAFKEAANKAVALNVPLVVAGDLQDTKAIIRAEVANVLLELTSLFSKYVPIYILVGNHDLITEKGDGNALNYLNSTKGKGVKVIHKHTTLPNLLAFIPYCSSIEKFRAMLAKTPKECTIIMHQGVKGAWMGEYVQDTTSVDPEELKDYTVISGHYHRHQRVGSVTYIGSPFTHTYSEATDGSKGFLVLFDDGSFEQEVLHLRKHFVLEISVQHLFTPVPEAYRHLHADDLLWLKVTGPRSLLQNVDKAKVGEHYIGHSNFKLDLIAEEEKGSEKIEVSGLSDSEIFDLLIQNMQETDSQKTRLLSLWKRLLQD